MGGGAGTLAGNGLLSSALRGLSLSSALSRLGGGASLAGCLALSWYLLSLCLWSLCLFSSLFGSVFSSFCFSSLDCSETTTVSSFATALLPFSTGFSLGTEKWS